MEHTLNLVGAASRLAYSHLVDGPPAHVLDPWTCFAHEDNTVTKANGMAKDVFGRLNDLRPDRVNVTTRRIKFDKDSKIGEKLVEPVWLTDEHGVTYNDDTDGADDLNDAVAAESKEASFTASEITLVTRVRHKTLSIMANGDGAAFKSFAKQRGVNMRRAMDNRVEIQTKYGGTYLGELESATDGGTTSVMTISFETFAPGIWGGKKNCRIDAYDGDTLLNADDELKITKVDIKNRQLTVTGDADDINDIVAIGTNGSGVKLYFKGAKGNDGVGLRTVAAHASGDLYGISATTYSDYWAATQIDAAGAPLSWPLLASALEESASRGNRNRMIVEVSLRGWSQLATDINSLRAIDASYKEKVTNIGTEGIVFHYHTGEIEVVPTLFNWQGDAIGYPDPEGEEGSDCRRVGSTDVTFNGRDGSGEIFLWVPGKSTCETRAYYDAQYYTTQVRDHFLIHSLGAGT